LHLILCNCNAKKLELVDEENEHWGNLNESKEGYQDELF